MGTIADILKQNSPSLNERRTSQRTPLVNLSGAMPLSNILRDDVQTSGTGAVTDETSEFKVRHAASGDFARLSSAGRGDYEPGFEMECGIGMRMDTVPTTGDFDAIWGYFDMQLSGGTNTENIKDGVIFGVDATGIFVDCLKDGTSQIGGRKYKSDWNGGNSTKVHDLTVGQIFQVDFLYYGYGLIKWQVVYGLTGDQESRVYTIHTEKIEGGTSLPNPNLQIGSLVKSSNTETDFSIFIGGRQVSIVGNYKAKGRVNSGRVEAKSIGTSFEPILTFRKKSTFRQVSIDLFSMSANSDGDAVIQIRVNADITGGTSPSFGSLNEQPDAQTALEMDTTATAVDTGTGIKVYEIIIAGGGGPDPSNLSNIGDIPVPIPDEGEITFAAKSLTGSSVTMDFLAKIGERW